MNSITGPMDIVGEAKVVLKFDVQYELKQSLRGKVIIVKASFRVLNRSNNGCKYTYQYLKTQSFSKMALDLPYLDFTKCYSSFLEN